MSTSPYHPPVASLPPQQPFAIPPAKPPSIIVFGILHLVFAGLGVISSIWGIFIAIAGNPFFHLAGRAGQSEQLKTQIALQEKMNPMTLASSALALLVAIPMIIAGIQLLRSRRNAIQWSNRYAWSSLVAKGINLILTLTIALPAMQEVSQIAAGGKELPQTTAIFAGSAIVGIIISCAYPIVALVLLNRPAPKSWIASQPA